MFHKLTTSDEAIIDGFNRVAESIKHTDAMDEFELASIREAMMGDNTMLSLNWLRNRIVQLRKQGKMKGGVK